MPKKGATRKQGNPKSNKKTEEEKIEEEITKPKIVRASSAKGKATSGGLNKTRDRQEAEEGIQKSMLQTSQDKQEGEDEEMPSKQEDSASVLSNPRKMNTRSRAKITKADSSVAKKSVKGSKDQEGEEKKKAEDEIIHDQRASRVDESASSEKKSEVVNQNNKQSRGPKKSSVSIKVKQSSAQSNKEHHNEETKQDASLPEETHLEKVQSPEQAIKQSEQDQEHLPASSGETSTLKKTNKKPRKSAAKKQNEESALKGEDLLLQEAMNADTIQIEQTINQNQETGEAVQEFIPVVVELKEVIVEPRVSRPQSQRDQIDPRFSGSGNQSKASIRSNLEIIKIQNPSVEVPLNEVQITKEAPPVPSSKKSTVIRNRKSEGLQAGVPEQSVQIQKLTEEELRAKYQDNPDYQEWASRGERLKIELEKGLKEGLPRIFYSELDIDNVANDFNRVSNLRNSIYESLENFRLQNIEPSGEGDFSIIDFNTVFEDDEVKRNLFKLISFEVEGSPLNFKELTQKCLQIILTEHFSSLSSQLNESHIEKLFILYAERVSYGIKGKNPKNYSDKTPIALWSWKVTDDELLSPVPESQIKKARTQRLIVGKKLTYLYQFLELCSDFNTYDSPEKISKLNQEFENYNKFASKESQSDWKPRKRRYNEVIAEDPPAASKTNRANTQYKSRIKPNEESSELLPISEASEAPLLGNIETSGVLPIVVKKNQSNQKELGNQTPVLEKQHAIINFFKRTEKPAHENVSQLNLRNLEELKKNPYISYTVRCQTEAMKLKQAYNQIPCEWFDAKGVINRFKYFKEQDLKSFDQRQQRVKNIQIHDSGMLYPGVFIDKSSRIINCKAPFRQDPSIINYIQDSDEEWEDLHGENLEDDDMVDEENQEVVEDEAEYLNMPNAGVSNAIKQRLAFRSQYCYQSLQYKEDDPELKEEGFIVADDYFSQESDEGLDGEINSDERVQKSRKDLLLKQIERQEQRTHASIRPYIFLDSRVDLGDYKAISLKRKVKAAIQLSRVSFGNISSLDAHQIYERFPLSVVKPLKPDETKVEIKDRIQELINVGHASVFSKKQLIDEIRTKFPELKKTHVDTFVKECFEKQKLALDSKTRLFARNDVVEKYGGSSDLIECLKIMYEAKLDEERIQKAKIAESQAAYQSVNPSPAQFRQSDVNGSSEEMAPPLPQQPTKKQSRQRQSGASTSGQKAILGVSSRKGVKSAAEDSRLSNLSQAVQNVIGNSERSQNDSLHAQASNFDHGQTSQGLIAFESKLSLQSDIIFEGDSKPIQKEAINPGTTTKTDDLNQDVDMDPKYETAQRVIEASEIVMQEENSWANVNNGVAIETPAFNTKIYDLAPLDQTDGVDHTFNQEFNADAPPHFASVPALQTNQSQSFYDEPQLQLSQHAIIAASTILDDEQKHVEISDLAFLRGNQQNQSTPIHNFRTLRSREISVNNSQNDFIGAVGDAEEEARPRSDSMETDKGNPRENMPPMTNLENHLENIAIAESQIEDGAYMQNSFESPQNNMTKTSFINLPNLIPPESIQYEESKELIFQHRDPSFGRVSSNAVVFDFRSHQVSNFEETSHLQETQKKRTARGSTMMMPRETESKSQPRRSKRLETKHQALLQNQDSLMIHYEHQDDELNHTFSENHTHHRGSSKRLSRPRPS